MIQGRVSRRCGRLAAIATSLSVFAFFSWQGIGTSNAAERTVLQTEDMTVLDSSGGKVATLSPFDGQGTSGISFASTKLGSTITYQANVDSAGYYQVSVRVKTNDVRGIYQLAVKGDPNSDFVNIGSPFDSYSKGSDFKTVDIGEIRLGKGEKRFFRFTAVDKNSESRSYQLVADYIALTPIRTDTAPVVSSTPAPTITEPQTTAPGEPPVSTSQPTTPPTTAPPTTAPQPTAPSTTTPPTVSSGRPDDSNTGAPNGVNLQTHQGNIIVTKDGTTIDGLDVHGQIVVRAANVTIKNSIVRGTSSSRNALVVALDKRVKNLHIENNTLKMTNSNLYTDGIRGHDFTATGNNISNTVDGIGVFNTKNGNGSANVTIKGNFIHDLAYFNNDPTHSDHHTHNDGVQIQGNSGITIDGNTINATIDSNAGDKSPYGINATGQAIGITPNVGVVTNVEILNNWLDYGAQSVTIIPGKFGARTEAKVSNNTFGGHQHNSTPILVDSSLRGNVTTSGNKMVGGRGIEAKFVKIG